MEFEIPVVDQEVDTDDPEQSALSVAGAVIGTLFLFMTIGVASYIYNRATEIAGVDGEAEIPGV
ncbi:sugar kinase [Salinibaculum sp. GCM10025337]|uniref:sugar kinase n=1 Tax=Salinibaculum sp. GCM10025337 TaxID=3252686 RepID=UPI00360DD7F2